MVLQPVSRPAAAAEPALTGPVGACGAALSRLPDARPALPPAWARPDQVTWSPAALLELARLRITLLTAARQAVIQARQVQQMLRTSALPNGERLVAQEYGLEADNAPLTIALDPDMGSALGSLSGRVGQGGRLEDLELRLNFQAFVPDTRANGTNRHVIENDRIVAHELTHAIMARTMDFASLPAWFAEGTAEYIAGGGERAARALRLYGPALRSALGRPWQNSSAEYAAAYLAVRFLDETTAVAGGIRRVMQELKAGRSLDVAIAATGAYGSEQELLDAFQGPAGARWLRGLELKGAGARSTNSGPAVVPDTTVPARRDPLTGFREQWAPLPWHLALQAYGHWR